MITAIFARLQNNGIGIDNRLPWKNKKYKNVTKHDMLFFKYKTCQRDIIMGYKTWESLEFKTLKNRGIHYIITSKEAPKDIADNIVYITFNSFIEFYKNNLEKNFVVIGGAQIYKLFLHYYDEIYCTTFYFEDDLKADTFIDKEIIDLMEDSTKTLIGLQIDTTINASIVLENYCIKKDSIDINEKVSFITNNYYN